MKFEKAPFILAQAGSGRYEYIVDASDQDFMVLSEMEDRYRYDEESDADYFFVSLRTLRSCWGHPLLLGNLTGNCTGNERLCAFLRERRQEITYAAPAGTALFGLSYIAEGEQCGYTSPVRAGLRTAMILSHMAAKAEDPFILSEEEKAVLLRARTGGVPPEERADIYRRTISPENIDRLMQMPDHPTIKKELLELIEEVITC